MKNSAKYAWFATLKYIIIYYSLLLLMQTGAIEVYKLLYMYFY